ncbi:MAG: LamG domain-containing protein [Sedimentisphaerales bacterium]|nr:LamG domain-containing protein [Sedimentisphaerales bacterium]
METPVYPTVFAAGPSEPGPTDITLKVRGDKNVYAFGFAGQDRATGVRKAREPNEYWHHVVAVYDGVNSQARLYIDGALDAQADIPAPDVIVPNDPCYLVRIGQRTDSNAIWPGAMDDFRIYDYPLTGSEIATLAAAGNLVPYVTAGDDQDLVHYLSGQNVQLDGELVVNDGNPANATLLWTVESAPAGAGALLFSPDATVENPTVTFHIPLVEGDYTFRLTADDTAVQVYDEVTIHLEVATCSDVVAQGLNPATDVNDDCYVDLADFALLAADWLECVEPQDPGCTWPW